MVLNRVNSTYTIDVATDLPNGILDLMLVNAQRNGITLAFSGVDDKRCFVRFRCGDDAAAVDLAHTLLTDVHPDWGILTTGYGVNQRRVSMA